MGFCEKELKEFLQAEVMREADLIMQIADADPTLKDMHAPDKLHEKLFDSIRVYENHKILKEAYEAFKDIKPWKVMNLMEER